MSLDSLTHNKYKQAMRASRVRSRIHGTVQRPRLSVHISNKHIMAQVIDDDAGRSLAYVTTAGRKENDSMAAKAVWVGEEIAKRAVKLKISQVAFDRGQHKYHGRIKNLAEAARAGGLEF